MNFVTFENYSKTIHKTMKSMNTQLINENRESIQKKEHKKHMVTNWKQIIDLKFARQINFNFVFEIFLFLSKNPMFGIWALLEHQNVNITRHRLETKMGWKELKIKNIIVKQQNG